MKMMQLRSKMTRTGVRKLMMTQVAVKKKMKRMRLQKHASADQKVTYVQVLSYAD